MSLAGASEGLFTVGPEGPTLRAAASQEQGPRPDWGLGHGRARPLGWTVPCLPLLLLEDSGLCVGKGRWPVGSVHTPLRFPAVAVTSVVVGGHGVVPGSLALMIGGDPCRLGEQ